jgi:aryl-alcohol dehydrogenase-like predicted oxidoreductase
VRYGRFGTTDFDVSAISLGCMSMSGSYGPADDAESIATLHRAFDLGVNFLDTSASYGNGHNHELIARALEGRRDRIFIHSKSGSPRHPDPSGIRVGGSPEYLTRVCEESLRRLRIETLDVFCMSRVDPTIPIEESVGAMAMLVAQGKTRYIGLSEASAESIRRAQKIHPIVSLQMEFSLWSRDAEEHGNLDACREFAMSLMAYGPVGQGFLAGRFHGPDDIPEERRSRPRYQPHNLDHNLKLLAGFEELAKEKRATPAQLAIAWLLAQGPDVVPIPSSKTIAHLEDNLGALDIELTKDDLARLDALMPIGAAAGPRTSEMHRVNV